MSDKPTEWVVNTDTGGIFPVTPVLIVQPPLEPYEPTEEEILVGRQIVHKPVVKPEEEADEPVTTPAEVEWTPPDPPPHAIAEKPKRGRPKKE